MVLREHSALVDDDDLLAEEAHLREDVAGEQDRALPLETADQVSDLGHLLGVETDRRLVEDQDLGISEERLCEADALAVALGELSHQTARHLT